jgi:hypothetical protein
MNRMTLCAALLSVASPAIAQAPHSYGDRLIDGLRAAHRAIAAIEIKATAKDGSPITLSRGTMTPGAAETVPLTNSMGDPVGTLSLIFSKPRHPPASAIAAETSRKIYLANNLIEPDPFVAGAHRSKVAQAIVDKMMASNPDLVTLGLHIGASGANNAILASNFGRIGKLGDKDDARVIDEKATLKEPTNGGRRLAVSLPMLDRKGRIVLTRRLQERCKSAMPSPARSAHLLSSHGDSLAQACVGKAFPNRYSRRVYHETFRCRPHIGRRFAERACCCC